MSPTSYQAAPPRIKAATIGPATAGVKRASRGDRRGTRGEEPIRLAQEPPPGGPATGLAPGGCASYWCWLSCALLTGPGCLSHRPTRTEVRFEPLLDPRPAGALRGPAPRGEFRSGRGG